MNNDDGRLPELIEKWKAKARHEEEDFGKRGEELKKKRCSCVDVMKRVVEPVLKERADYLKRRGFHVEAGLDKNISEPSRPAYRFSFEYPGGPNALINCDEESGVVLFTAKTVARSEVQKREGWDKQWDVDDLKSEDLARELRLFCEEVIEHLVSEPCVRETVAIAGSFAGDCRPV
jgi:hypothetical protein